ncbi:hypothetical protein OPQ81_005257 [Rhizoctonia solani]|nr:hypothetical protein OPQ81_005257 [Rhizoctonia solani]
MALWHPRAVQVTIYSPGTHDPIHSSEFTKSCSTRMIRLPFSIVFIEQKAETIPLYERRTAIRESPGTYFNGRHPSMPYISLPPAHARRFPLVLCISQGNIHDRTPLQSLGRGRLTIGETQFRSVLAGTD